MRVVAIQIPHKKKSGDLWFTQTAAVLMLLLTEKPFKESENVIHSVQKKVCNRW